MVGEDGPEAARFPGTRMIPNDQVARASRQMEEAQASTQAPSLEMIRSSLGRQGEDRGAGGIPSGAPGQQVQVQGLDQQALPNQGGPAPRVEYRITVYATVNNPEGISDIEASIGQAAANAVIQRVVG